MLRSLQPILLGLGVSFALMLRPPLLAQVNTGKRPSSSPSIEKGVKLPTEIRNLFQDGEKLKDIGKSNEAAEKFQKAADKAAEVKEPGFNPSHIQSAALLRKANIHYSEAIKSNNLEKLSATLKLYEELPAGAAPQQKSEAIMNSAAIQMKLGEPLKAADLLLDKQLWQESVIDPSQRFRLNYNVGRAFEEGRQSSKAIEYYGASLRLNPRFNLAATKISDLALADKSLSPKALDQQLDVLISTKHAEEVIRLGWGLFQREGKDNPTGAMKGLSILLTGWSMAFEDTETCLKSQGQLLSQLGDSFLGPRLERDLKRLIQGELSIEVDSLDDGAHPQLAGINEVLEKAGANRSRLKVAFAALIFSISDYLATQSSLAEDARTAGELAHKALARNLVAFGLDPSNADVARSLTWSLVRVEESGQIEEIDKLRDQVVRQLLNKKESLRFKTKKTVSDWQNLLKIHMLLAQLFQSKKIWTASNEYRSATFHWEEARRDEAALHKLLPENRRQWTPALHENLAICYAHSDRKPAAIVLWLDACHFYLLDDNVVGASRCLQSVRSSGVELNAEQREQVASLEKRVQELDQLLKNATK